MKASLISMSQAYLAGSFCLMIVCMNDGAYCFSNGVMMQNYAEHGSFVQNYSLLFTGISESLEFRISGIPEFRILGIPGFRISGFPEFWIFGFPEIPNFGNLTV